MDAPQYKGYMPVLLSIKYVFDKYADVSDASIKVAKDGCYADMVALKGKKESGDKIISNLAERPTPMPETPGDEPGALFQSRHPLKFSRQRKRPARTW